MRLFVSLLLSLYSVSSFALCGKESARGVEYTWCIEDAQKTEVTDILYYLHGGGGSEKGWEQSGYNTFLASRWAALGYKHPAVITVSFGTQWLLSDMETKAHPALLNLFAEEIMPYLEKKIPGNHGKRMLLGPSMGGYNGSELALRYPQLWDRVALMCPGLGITDPFQTDEQIEDFIAKEPKSTNPDFVRGITAWVRREFVTAENWSRHDPMLLAQLAVSAKASYLVSCSKPDEYGFFRNAQRFSEIMGVKTTSVWHPVETGGHCSLDKVGEDVLAKFLAGQ